MRTMYRPGRGLLKPSDDWAVRYERAILTQRHGQNPICVHNFQVTREHADEEHAAGQAACKARQVAEWAAENPPEG